MYRFLVSCLKILLLVSLAVLLILLVFGLALALGWPWWTGAFMLIGLSGLVAGFLFLKKIWLRRRERRFINQVIAQDEAYIQSLGEKERQNSKELQQRWKEAIQTLRQSHLRKYGNPLYVLPWYMLVGESGSGKTTAIQSARLSSPFAEMSSTSGISGTKNCDWWFFDKAILIDTAGRYTVPVDESRDSEEWEKFLTQLGRFRKKEPLNGLVVTIAADQLMDAGPETVEDAARRVRRRVDELMHVLGAKFPIYLMVTKCDLIEGMTHFCNQLDESGQSQAMGALNQDFSKKTADFIHHTMDSLVERLKDLRLLMLQKTPAQSTDPGLLVFPEAFKNLGPGLDVFIRGAFQETPYKESPLLRGLFFSSGKQEGTPYSHFLKELGLIARQEVLPGTNKGLFLHDFFSRILPGDRGLFAPTQAALQWRRLTRNLGLTAWMAIAVAACGLLSFSFVQNLSAIQGLSREFQQPIVFENDIVDDTIAMSAYLDAIKRVEEKNRSFWIPRLGLTESLAVEKRLKQNFCDNYYNGFLKRFDNRTAAHWARFSAMTPQKTLGTHAAHLVRRINLLQAALAGEGGVQLRELFRPAFAPLITQTGGRQAVPDLGEKLSELYWHYVHWQPDNIALKEEMRELRKWLGRLLTLEGAPLNWLVEVVNSDPTLSPVLISDFWGSGRMPADVPRAFTTEGKARVDALVAEMEQALHDELVLAEKKLDFYQWYNRRYIESWKAFAEAFAGGAQTLEDKDEWVRIASRIGSDKDPYFVLMDTMARHLEPFQGGAAPPAWVAFIYDFQAARGQGAIYDKKAGASDAGLVRKAARKVTSSLRKAEQAVGVDPLAGLNPKERLLAGKAFSAYQTALSEITAVSASRQQAYEMAAAFYKNPEASDDSAALFAQAYAEAETLKSILSEPGKDLRVMDRLLSGPVEFLHQFVLAETACHLQSQWEDSVLLEVRDISRQNVNQLLMGENGLVRHFVEGEAGPFLARSPVKGYHPLQVKKRSVGFHKPFLSYLTRAERASRTVQATYNVVVKADPAGANPGARTLPEETVLELQCAGAATRLVNQSYPKSQNFSYSPQDCGDVVLTIKLGNLVLSKSYTGYLAFPEFIREFENSGRRFSPDAFPEHAATLRRMDLEYIRMNFDFQNHKPVMDFYSAANAPLPDAIAPCWQ